MSRHIAFLDVRFAVSVFALSAVLVVAFARERPRAYTRRDHQGAGSVPAPLLCPCPTESMT